MRGGDLSTWVSPERPDARPAPRRRLDLIKQVVDLKAPATYRFEVSFRWIGAHGKVLGHDACETSPTLLPARAAPGPAGQDDRRPGRSTADASVDEYVALIRNRGATAAGPFQVQFTDGSAVEKTHSVAGLGPHASINERFVGPLVHHRARPP